MNKKLFLTSLTAIAFAMPAMAEPSNTESTFPSNELMLQDTTYQNQANYTNMGVYNGEVSANAEYEWNIIPIVAGTYLPGGQTSTTQCTTGNFCPGVATNNTTRTPHYQTVQEGDQGLTSCSTTTNGVYTGSAAGATASTDCYRSCANSDITHATGITGNVYYNGTDGDGVKDCTPTTCENGWHVKAAVVAPNLISLIGVTEAGTGSTANTYTGAENFSSKMSNTIISNDPMAFALDYGNGKGVIKGHGRCSKTGVTTPWYNTQGYQFASDHFVNNLTDETNPTNGGQYCYCQLDSYTPVNGSAQSLSAPWVFNNDFDLAGHCAQNCATRCVGNLQYADTSSLAFRAAVFGSLQSSPAMCEGNQITISWGDVDPDYAGNNNEGTAIYGEDIRTPFKAATKPGQTFKGWKFVKPQN